MLEITATEIAPCPWPDCTKPITEGSRVVYTRCDRPPVHAHHIEALRLAAMAIGLAS